MMARRMLLPARAGGAGPLSDAARASMRVPMEVLSDV